MNNRNGERLWTTYDVNYGTTGRHRDEREFRDENKTSAFRRALQLTGRDRALMGALVQRQSLLASIPAALGSLLSLEALSVAPFSTGLGNEHPLENGFTFLSPYGLPYLPGSGVKGVLRQAARELACGDWGDTGGWTQEARRMREAQKTLLRQQARQAALRRTEELAAMPPIERELGELMDARQDRNQTGLSVLFAALKRNHWGGADKVAAAQHAAAFMRKAGKWKPASEKKNPQKDHDHQATLLVSRWLDGKPP